VRALRRQKRRPHLRREHAVWAGAVAAAGGALAAALRFFRRSKRTSALEDLTKDELYERAREADIEGRSEMTKEELIDALRKSR
jgi:Rho termination factor-like protein